MQPIQYDRLAMGILLLGCTSVVFADSHWPPPRIRPLTNNWHSSAIPPGPHFCELTESEDPPSNGENPAAPEPEKEVGSSDPVIANPLRLAPEIRLEGADAPKSDAVPKNEPNPDNPPLTAPARSKNTGSEKNKDGKNQEDRQESPELPPASKEVNDSHEAALSREIEEPKVKPQIPSKTPVAADKSTTTVLTQAQRRMKQRTEACLAFYLANPESVVKRSPWALMHAMLSFGVDTQVKVGTRNVNAIGWMCYNGTCRTQQVFDPKSRSLLPNVGDGMQGHEGQFLAMLAQSSVASDYPIRVANRSYTVADLARYEMSTCKEGTELTFKLISLSHYLAPEQTWVTSDRKRWSVEKLVREELSQSVNGAACGGTHRLMGLTYATKVRQAQGLPIDGEYARAAQFIEDYIQYAWSLQNPDGSFSTSWFEGRANEPDLDRKVQTTGHILEWLIFAMPSKQLESPRVHKSLEFLIANLFDNREHNWAIGPRSHALRAIALYDEKVFGVRPGTRHTQLAELKDQLQLRR